MPLYLHLALKSSRGNKYLELLRIQVVSEATIFSEYFSWSLSSQESFVSSGIPIETT